MPPHRSDPLAWIDRCTGAQLGGLLAQYGRSVADRPPSGPGRSRGPDRPAPPEPARQDPVPVPLRHGWLLVADTGLGTGRARLHTPGPEGPGAPAGPPIDLAAWRTRHPGWQLIRTDVSADARRWLFVLRNPDLDRYQAAVYQVADGRSELIDLIPACAPDCLLSADGALVVYAHLDARGWPTTVRVRQLDGAGRERTVLVTEGGPGGRVRARRTSHPGYALLADGVRPHLRVSVLDLADPQQPLVPVRRVHALDPCDVGRSGAAAVLYQAWTDPAGAVHLSGAPLGTANPWGRERRLGSIGTVLGLRATNGALLVHGRDHTGDWLRRCTPPGPADPARPDAPAPWDASGPCVLPDATLLERAGPLDISGVCLARSVGAVAVERCVGTAPAIHVWDHQWRRIRWAGPLPVDARSGLVRREIEVPAAGATLQLSLAWRPGPDPGAGFTGPVVLFVYGAYGTDLSLAQVEEVPALTGAGIAVGTVRVRGGAGPPGWHDAGRGANKLVPVDDLRATVEHLRAGRAAGITVTALGLVGASAGGFLIGAALNRYGRLIDAAVVTNGFLDPVPALLDRDSPLAVSDRAEWGDPTTSAEAHHRLSTLSPYTNLKADLRSSVLLLVSDQDRQVSPAQSLKWFLKASALGAPVDLWYFPRSGHTSMRGGARAGTAAVAWLVARLAVAAPATRRAVDRAVAGRRPRGGARPLRWW